MKGNTLSVIHKFSRWTMCNAWYPFIILSGIFFPAAREWMEILFVKTNNKMVKNLFSENGNAGRNALVLLPHCLQNDECDRRIIKSVINCLGCGKCCIAGIKENITEKGLNTRVATGGRLAKRWITEEKPDLVIAVACERELCEGIFSVFPLPVIAVPNKRPHGPCINTDVDIDVLMNHISCITECGRKNAAHRNA